MAKKMKPKGKKGRVAVKRLGRNYKTGNFNKIAKNVAKNYQKKGISKKKAEEIGKKVAGKIYWNKVKARKRKRKK